MKWPHREVPARQAPLAASLRSATVLAQLDSPQPPDSQLEEELRAEVRPEMFVAVREEEIARAKSTQARGSIGRH